MLTILSLFSVVKPRRCAASPTFDALTSNKLVSHYGLIYFFIFTKHLFIAIIVLKITILKNSTDVIIILGLLCDNDKNNVHFL